MKKRLLALVLGLTLSFTAALAAPCRWVDASIVGTVTADTQVSLKDDFYQAVNKDWLSSAKLTPTEPKVSLIYDRSNEVRGQIVALLEGSALAGHEAQLVQTFYRQYVDMDARNALGMEPFRPYLQGIQNAATLSELQAALTGEYRDSTLAVWTASADLADSAHYVAYITSSSLLMEDADDYNHPTESSVRMKNALNVLLNKLLVRAGYTGEQAADMVGRAFSLDAEIASASLGRSAQKAPDYLQQVYNPMSIEELKALSPAFPIMDYLPTLPETTERVILTDKGWLSKMNELYTEDRLEDFKALMICREIKNFSSWLDQPCIDLKDECTTAINGAAYVTDIKKDAYNAVSADLPMAVGRMFADNCITPQTKAGVSEMVRKIIANYRSDLENNTWLSKETRQKAIEKLDGVLVRVAYPDDWTPYNFDGLTLKGNDEGGSLAESLRAIDRYNDAMNVKYLENGTVDRAEWKDAIVPQVNNAFYDPQTNSINILGGILGKNIYDPEQPDAFNLGRLGIIVGHELSHAFDTFGSQFDAQGNVANWWTDADRAAFNERTKKVADYYSAMEVLPGEFVDGQQDIGETVADLGGLSCAVQIGRNTPGFDFDLFFRSYAIMWRSVMTKENEEAHLHDTHAPDYLRVNVGVQQFEEFYTTYGIEAGDGMYLAPEERLSVW